MTSVGLLPLLLALYVALRAPWATLAKHWTCSWTGPGNDPYRGGFTQYCVGNKTAEDFFSCDYSCPGKDGFTMTVATYGKLGKGGDWEYGIMEFATPCNSHGWAPNEDCDPSTWGLCLGIRSNTTGDFNECYYMQFYDDCEWPRVISNLDKPDHVTVFKKSYTLNEERLDERKRIAARSAERTDHVAGVFPSAARLLSQPASSAGIDEPRQVEDGRGAAGKEDHSLHDRDFALPWSKHSDKVELSAAGESYFAGQERRAGVASARQESQQSEDVLAKKTTRAAEYGKGKGVFARVRSLERERSASTQPMMTKKESLKDEGRKNEWWSRRGRASGGHGLGQPDA